MFSNPFSPIFGGKPDVFFGRDRILSLFDIAMIDSGSDERAIFITGTRGSGKTALLEQLSIRAAKKKRRVIDLGPENTIEQLIHELIGYDEVTNTISPQANVNILGVGGGVSGAISKTRHIGREMLQPLLLESCAKTKQGLLVTVDEIQKVSIEDVSALCNAFQMASRKGYDIMLAVAGLPYAYSDITRHEGCTYLRRASHEEIGLFTWDEAADALNKVFSSIKGLVVDKSILDRINQVSYGHPYLMQLLGYHLILQVNNSNQESKKHVVTENELMEAEKNAILSYEQRALKPLFDELPDSERHYLTKMSECIGENRFVSTADISKAMGTTQNKLSKIRAYLINHGIIAAPEHGKVMFCIPYLADYVKKDRGMANAVEVAMQRRV